jgi:sporulation protein YlmC with PRC-barrel domain
MQLIENALVNTADGHTIGHITHIVLDPATKKATHIVVRHGTIFPEERVVPLELIQDSTLSGMNLSVGIDELHKLPKFEESCFVAVELPEVNELAALAGIMGGWLYFYPPPDHPIGTHQAMEHSHRVMRRYVESTIQNIPEGEIALKEGAHVTSSDQHRVGHIESVLVDSETGYITHLLISKGVLLKGRKLVPVSWIGGLDENEVHLSVNLALLERLPLYR